MRKLASVAIVFGGIVVLSTTPTLLVYVLQSVQYSGEFGLEGLLLALLTLIPPAIALIAGRYLIKNRHELAARWFDEEPISAMPETLSMLRLGLILMGLWLAISSAGEVFTMIVSALDQLSYAKAFGEVYEVGANWVLLGRVAISAVMVVLGSILVKNSESIAKRLWQGPEIVAEDND